MLYGGIEEFISLIKAAPPVLWICLLLFFFWSQNHLRSTSEILFITYTYLLKFDLSISEGTIWVKILIYQKTGSFFVCKYLTKVIDIAFLAEHFLKKAQQPEVFLIFLLQKFLLTFARLLSIKSNTHITFHYIVVQHTQTQLHEHVGGLNRLFNLKEPWSLSS